MTAAASWEEAVAAGAIGGIALDDLAAQHGTPCFVYSADMIQAAVTKCRQSVAPLDARLRYAVKANGNLGVLRQVLAAGIGCDVASVVELARVRECGAQPGETIFTGPGKGMAVLAQFANWGGEEIICESPGELRRLVDISATAAGKVTVGVRVNPDIKAGAHPHISTGLHSSKFGVSPELVVRMVREIAAAGKLRVGSLNCHIGSQVDGCAPYREAFHTLQQIQGELADHGIAMQRLDLGGGFSIGDSDARPRTDVLAELATWLGANHPGQAVGFQPGRSLVGRAGIILTRVEYVKERHVIVDAAMTELLRPALYAATHGVAKVGQSVAGPGELDVVGPVCESADWLARGRDLDVDPGDLLAVFDAGAYAAAMMSGYNGRLRPCEVMVTPAGAELVRRRDTIAETLAQELGN